MLVKNPPKCAVLVYCIRFQIFAHNLDLLGLFLCMSVLGVGQIGWGLVLVFVLGSCPGGRDYSFDYRH